ncbi:MAG: TadE family protein, partial [Pseudomonadota bacterium]
MRACAKKNQSGQSITEFALILPFVFVLIFTVIEGSLTAMRTIAAKYAAVRAARVAAVYQRGLAGRELHASLSPLLFRGGVLSENEIAGN